ncbi:hypothetical protein L6164_028926 [Bauhinia variegata]|uniref:Uncharacterized protein n=1 Tax=Bauhinia variegata TaxID=167791 RepID=A0ACB9L7N0_BAUVA|nr:hypothetical protein L6164_028926 [Bauhinia variegata]
MQPSSTCIPSTKGSGEGTYLKLGIKCSSPICSERSSNCSSTSPCIYSIEYGDKTTSQGIYGRDRLTLTRSDVIDNFLFGCGTRNSGTFHELEEDGILGLSRNPISIVQQTAKKYHQVFSYCIPSKSGFTGFLRFGGGGQESIIYTPMTNYKDSSFYGINMIGISVAGKKLPIPSTIFAKGGSIIDSGTDVTRLPRDIYIPLRDAYRKAMAQYKLVKPEDLGQISELFDTCHFLGRQKSFKFPKVSFILSGGVAVDIPPSGIYFQVLKTVVCFAFSAKPLDGAPGIIWGSIQQRTLEVVYDVGKRKIGFGYGACK